MAVLGRFFGGKKLVSGCVRQVVVIYINVCMRISPSGLSIGRLIGVVVRAGSTVFKMRVTTHFLNHKIYLKISKNMKFIYFNNFIPVSGEA